jgi:ribose transport system ATP-binding protein
MGERSGGTEQREGALAGQVVVVTGAAKGIDIKTKYALHDLIWDLAAQGRAVRLNSSDMPEMSRLADRILVMKDNRIIGELENTHQYDQMSTLIMQDLA